MIGTAVHPLEVFSRLKIDVPTTLWRSHLILDWSECLSRNLLISERAIDLGGTQPAIVDILVSRLDATFAAPLDVLLITEQGEARISQ
ncbi:hypothetical protein [Bradyrhizobium sp. Leo121]|uniref:hypothetical protein n=1 Tax=Bradyrhizobium sp. Leo121 TaxID=1571195 RepID=UPI001FE21858|nr:hypothetical protein [Bradyrhizobium sp. Leo121]